MSNLNNPASTILSFEEPKRRLKSQSNSPEHNGQKICEQSEMQENRNASKHPFELLFRTKTLGSRVITKLVLVDLKRITKHLLAEPLSSNQYSEYYSELEDHYESLLLRQSHQGVERRLTLAKLSIVCRLLGKKVEADHLEERCQTGRYGALGTAGFWSLIGY